MHYQHPMPSIDSKIKELRQHAARPLTSGSLAFKNAFESIDFTTSSQFKIENGVVKIGESSDLTKQQEEKLLDALKVFIPWKKGPYEVFGHSIDSEWQSNLKWDRIAPHLNLDGKVIADIGCHNGYFMFRMSEHNPKACIGFEPVYKNYYNYLLLQHFAQRKNLFYETLGVEHIGTYKETFDYVFLMGILYHHQNPLKILNDCRDSMSKGGKIVIDCQGIQSEEAICLTPKGRYTQARGIWFLPSLECLKNWLHRLNFRNIECVFQEKLSPMEQRPTEWAPIASLQNFLNPEDPEKTIEGYPAPWRFYLIAEK